MCLLQKQVLNFLVPYCDWLVPYCDWLVPYCDWLVPYCDWLVPYCDWFLYQLFRANVFTFAHAVESSFT